MFHNRFYGGLRIFQREQFVSDKAFISALFQMPDYFFIIDLSRSGFMTPGSIRDMHMAYLIAIGRNRVTEAAFVQLHMIGIKKNVKARVPDQTADFCPHLRRLQEISHMIRSNIQRFQIQIHAIFVCQLHTCQQHIIHGTQLYGIGEVIIVIYHYTAVPKGIGMNRHTPGAQSHCCLQSILKIFQVSLFMGGINQRIIIITIKPVDYYACLVCASFPSAASFFIGGSL